MPLYAQYRLNSVTGREEWHVAFDAYQPSLRKEGRFWQFPDESVGDYFFHAVAEPSPSLYEPSSITVPLNLRAATTPSTTGTTTAKASAAQSRRSKGRSPRS